MNSQKFFPTFYFYQIVMESHYRSKLISTIQDIRPDVLVAMSQHILKDRKNRVDYFQFQNMLEHQKKDVSNQKGEKTLDNLGLQGDQ